MLLIDLIIVDVTGKDFLECEAIMRKMPKELIADIADTFEKFGYEMAKGVFINEMTG